VYDALVVKWERYWLVTIRTAIPGGWPHTDVREVVAESPAELREIVETARADVRVLGFRYESRRRLVTDDLVACPNGHRFVVEGLPYPQWHKDFINCACGGHAVITCTVHVGGDVCGAQSIEPPPAFDCDVTWPHGHS
jgi:hypothetical protein